MDKIYYTWYDIERYVADIAIQMWGTNWRPDYIVGVHSGGSIPAVRLGKMVGIKTHTLDVRLRDGAGPGPESNFWMAEDAFGYEKDPVKILIIDDINDSGATINWIINDWPSGCFPNADDLKNDIWNVNVRFAVVVDNLASDCLLKIDYTGMEVNKAEKDVWIEFPFEEWWAK